MKILVVSQYYHPEPFRVTDLCQRLRQAGHEVTVLCGIPNYPQGKYYSGYGTFKKRKETLNGVRILRVFQIPRGQDSKIRLMLNYFSFAFCGCLKTLFLRKQFDVVYTWEISPITLALPACLIRLLHRIPHVLYVMDLWPENVQAVSGISNPRIMKWIGKLVDFIYRRCDLILTSSQSFCDCIAKRGHPAEKLMFLPQCATEESVFGQQIASPIDLPQGVNIVFTGNIGEAQGLGIVPRAAAILQEKDIRFIIIGDGRGIEALKQDIQEAGVADKVLLYPRQDAEKIPAILAKADAALLCLEDNPVFQLYLPAKLQTYLTCGIPVLCATQGEAARVIMDAGAGYVCDAGDAKGLADIVQKVYNMKDAQRNEMRIRGIAYAKKWYDPEVCMDALQLHLQRMVDRS